MVREHDELPYNFELVNDSPVLWIPLSSTWVSYLLGVAEILRNAEIWDSDDDVNLALKQADSLCALLMGEDYGGSSMGAPLPWFTFASDIDWNPACNPTFNDGEHDWATGGITFTDNVSESRVIARFQVPLLAGNYVFRLGHRENVNLGILEVTSPTHGYLFANIDMYSAVLDAGVTTFREFEIADSGLVEFELKKAFKNPLATYGVINITSISIKKLGEWS